MKSEKFTFSELNQFGRFIKLSLLSAMLTFWVSGAYAQTQSCPLACNNLVQVSMDEDCIVEITPDMMLEGQGLPANCTYVVQVIGINGKPLPAPSPLLGFAHITSANIGQTLDVRIFLGANSCWGRIKIEDKLAPVIVCPADLTITCYDNRAFSLPTATDNCGGLAVVKELSNVLTESGCASIFRATRVIRYQATDASGNVSNICTRTIYYSQVTLANVRFPKNYDGGNGQRPALECDGTWEWGRFVTSPTGTSTPINNWDTNNNGYPDPNETGSPFVADPANITGYVLGYKVGTPIASGVGLTGCTAGNLVGNNIATGIYQSNCDGNSGMANFRIDTFYSAFIGNSTLCKLNTTFTDTRIDICPKSFKVLRQWTVLDWCSSQTRQMFQIIKLEDTKAPIVTCPADLTSSLSSDLVAGLVSADPYTCTGMWAVRPPITISDCNTTTWIVKVKKADNSGNDPGPDVEFVTKDGQLEVIGTFPNFTIIGLPLGRTWVKYIVTDACGNEGFCFTEVDVVDTTPPVAVCDEFTVVTLSNNGWAHVFAETFDDGSHDNCTAVTFDVRRMTPGCNASTTVWGPFVQICCEDVGREVMVELRVTDAFGNRNTCMVTVNAQDKVAPIITCPANVTINCGADTSSVVLGRPVFSATPLTTPYFTDNCTGARLSWRNSGAIDDCGQGIITRTFTVVDRGGRSASCSQIITVRNTTPYNGPSSWPTSPFEVNGCMNIDTDPAKTGRPNLGNGTCSQVAHTYEDQVFPFVDGVCFKILRKWTVIDWCKFAPNRNTAGNQYPGIPTEGVNMWTYTQIIKVSENVKPVINTCTKAPTDAFGENCNGFVELTNTAIDCTPANQLTWKYVIDPNNDGKTPFIQGNTNDASGTYPVGSHRITWTVEDMCGNQSTCEYVFVVRDRKKPTPYCRSEVTTVVMPSTGTVTIKAEDFNIGSFDNCPGTLTYSFSTNRNETTRTYTCSNLGINTVTMYVWDAAGNFDFCTVSVNIQANGSACSGARLAGSIGTENNQMVKDVSVVLENMNSTEVKSQMTNQSGGYDYANIPELVSYKITPEKNDDVLNGVSTLDLVMIQRHLLNIAKFNSPYKYIAADINKDSRITAGDLTELRKVILGINSNFPANKSWRFLDKAVAINDITQPYSTNEYIYIAKFDQSMMANDFVAVKTGDIDGSATVNAQSETAQTRTNKTLVLSTEDKTYEPGETLKVEVTAENVNNLSGAQWTLNFDHKNLEFAGVRSGAITLDASNYNAATASNGKVAFSWNQSDGLILDKTKVLFTLEFRAIANNTISKTLSISSDITKAEAYTTDLSEMNMNLEFRKVKSTEIFELGQNNPNPFEESTVINFNLPKAAAATITIYDLSGKVVKTIKTEGLKGANRVTVNASDLKTSGILFYELESLGLKATKKMINLK